MKGVLLANENLSFLPESKTINKYMFPVFDKPMILYPLETLKNSGITEILVIAKKDNLSDFISLLGSGKNLGLDITYKIQDSNAGSAYALNLAKSFAQNDNVAVISGDNIYENDFAEKILSFKSGACVFAKKIEDTFSCDTLKIDTDNNVIFFEESNELSQSEFVPTEFFLYDQKVFDYIDQIEPSDQGKLELKDVNKFYLEKKELKAHKILGNWSKIKNHESLLEASILSHENFNTRKINPLNKKNKFSKNIPKIVVGILTYNSEKYIEACLNSLKRQNYKNLEIVIFDNYSEDKTLEIIEQNFADVRIIKSQENIGFSKANNEILRQSDGDFYLALNVDILCESNFVSSLLEGIDQKATYGSVGGKIKRWDFESFQLDNADWEKGKTNFIDSIGIRILKSHRFENIGEGEVDYGQFDEQSEIFGVSGSAVLFRRKALEDIAFVNEEGKKEFFDESMFMYKEDIDIAYRLQWAGWKSVFIPNAVAYHDRTIQTLGEKTFDIIKNRAKKLNLINKMSYLNHHILLKKNFSKKFSKEIRSATFFYNLKTFFYLLFFETELLGQWWKLMKIKKNILHKKKSMPKRVSSVEIEKLMEQQTI